MYCISIDISLFWKRVLIDNDLGESSLTYNRARTLLVLRTYSSLAGQPIRAPPHSHSGSSADVAGAKYRLIEYCSAGANLVYRPAQRSVNARAVVAVTGSCQSPPTVGHRFFAGDSLVGPLVVRGVVGNVDNFEDRFDGCFQPHSLSIDVLSCQSPLRQPRQSLGKSLHDCDGLMA